MLKELRLDSITAHWFAKFLFDCLSGQLKDFYLTIREGNCRFIAQLCSNVKGRFMELAEYGGGNRCKFLFIPEDFRGKGWCGVAEALWAMVAVGRPLGAKQSKALVPQASTQNQSFKEVLSAECKGGDGSEQGCDLHTERGWL